MFLKDKVQLGVHFLVDGDDLIHGYQLFIVCGEHALPSAPVELDWPWQPMPMPEAMKGMLN